MKQSIGVIFLTVAVLGCGGEAEQLSPLATSSTSSTSSAPVDAGIDAAPPPPPPVDAGVVKRTVMTRNPFGAAKGNHLIDGDFEMSTTYYSGQFGWRAFTSDGATEVPLATETGGLCRSGLRCAVAQPNTLMLIRGAAANGKGNVASAWAKVAGDVTCSRIHPILIRCDTFVVTKQLSLKGSEDGWCHYAISIGEQDTAMCIYVENTLQDGTTAILDDFLLGPDDGTVQPLSAEFWAPTAETVMRLESMRERVIVTTPFGKPPRVRLPSP